MDTQFNCCQCGEPTQKRLNLEEIGFFSLCEKEECKAELWRDLMRKEVFLDSKDVHFQQFQKMGKDFESVLLGVSIGGILLLISIILVVRFIWS